MLTQIDNFFSEPLLRDLKKASRTIKKVRTNITDIEPALIGFAGAIVLIDLPSELEARIKDEINPRIDSRYHNMIWRISIHLGSRLSYIPWHDDRTHALNITVYMNDKWDIDYAGYFVYDGNDGLGLRAILPRRNLGIIYSTPMPHSVSLASLNAPIRESLQIFINAWEPEEEGFR